MVNIPIAGNVPGPVVAIAVAGGVGALGFSLWRKKKNAAAAAAATPPDTGPVTTSDAYGYGYPADEYGYGAYTYGSNYPNYYGYGGFNAGLPSPPSAPPSETNAQWTQNAVQALSQFDNTAVLAALGVYLTGGTLTADQERIVRAAIGAEGYPPVAGAGGYPPGIHSSAPTGQPSADKVAIPNVVGMNFGKAYNTLTSAGLISVPGHNGTHAAWKVTSESPRAGTQVSKGSVVRLTVPQPK